MKLLIVESPSKAKTIEKYLGKDFRVVASVGHVRDLPKSNRQAIDIEAGFVPHYEVVKGKEKVISEIKSLAKKTEEVFLATDPDREGEAIAWHVAEAVGLKKSKRIVFHEITKEAVEEALEHPREIDMNLKEAQEARRVLDRLVGYDLSGLIWKKVRYGLSAGRVQSPALRIIMEREREIRAFLPQTFWTIEADLRDGGNTANTFVCSVEPTEKKEVERILELGNSSTWQVTDIKETQIARSPKAPFITSTLQQTASSRLGWSPSRTMSIAQRLYEAGYITYMRTDSTNLGTQAKLAIQNVVNSKFGPEYFEGHQFAKKSKNAQEAHEAIRPTHLNVEMAGATEEQHRLYRLIWQRAVASQMKNAEVMRTKVVAKPSPLESDSQGEGLADFPDFWLNGSRILFDGWLKADPLSASEDVVLPKFKNGESLKLLDIRSAEKQTEPPARYSEAGLIKELEKRGIGRPSTYASIIKTLEDRGYVEKISKALHPTDVGEVVSSFLEDNFPSYISDSFTAEMEDELDEIASGDRTYLKTLKDFYTPFIKDVKAKEKIEKITNLGKAPAEMKCPTCGGEMIIKLGKGGKFYSCERFPDCAGARTLEGKELEGPKDTGELCPKCSKGNLVTREGKFGMFTACSRFPKCKFVKKDEEQERANSTGVQCPVCKNGFLSERRGRFGVFYSCSNYPDCKYAIKAKPTGNICKLCGALMMEGTKTIPERCSDKSCPNHNPHKLDKSK
ncbi:MAG: topoisomerase protein [Parcubacteria group bacterium GW2011_GWB1_49_7]|uniref:DNA topoisomerase 1 n=1 Tax=Candidatus Zambryskibacteria bacterium RIFCSPHIGHO2_01_FULL_46_25 TaxID=1802738 RepID=A0A1G2SZD0_9BACT|nr:MAG: topoisomerase protein [Parcubacteria group bacterium GW2011_GWA1_47_10]KKW10021.1 MAG: topoisomerase protein [Parcubacteria group bacterium GW2011_GWB1_49_7]OHA90373.1 MAG: DNA topoisomerase I [Candidatus Zambryskibacteria bacterium RIFCSPHIGHO2_01_FULL_46_25]OHB06910.1 MAG: DNA topoisomerase I [Candidatus Zambryskibacteria bacterium RIFCSPLOWO2_01_FULL_48_25]